MAVQPVYLDYNATTPVDRRVLEAMLPWFTEKFGNAASDAHPYGWEAAAAVRMGRETLAAALQAEPDEIVFTSGATESLNLAIQGVAQAYSGKGQHLITVATEHKAVLDTYLALEARGFTVTFLPVDADGRVNPDDLKAALRPDTLLVTVMAVNNETGVIQDISRLAALTHEAGALFLCDATQALGKMPIDVQAMGIDLLACSAHKIYGPKGVGALYVRRRDPRVRVMPLIFGGGHERGMRSGTLNVHGIVGLSTAVKYALEEMDAEKQRLSGLRDLLENALLHIPGVRVNGSRIHRAAHVTNLCFHGHPSEMLLGRIYALAVSPGSACNSASADPSHVLRAMGLSDDDARASLRFSLGRFTTEADIRTAIEVMQAALTHA